jgi:hypothetical protein
MGEHVLEGVRKYPDSQSKQVVKSRKTEQKGIFWSIIIKHSWPIREYPELHVKHNPSVSYVSQLEIVFLEQNKEGGG